MLSQLNRYQFARFFCWLMRGFGWGVMLYPDHFGHQAHDVEYDMRTKKHRLLYLAGIINNKALLKMHRRYVTVVRVPQWLRIYFWESWFAYKCLDEGLSRPFQLHNHGESAHGDVWGQEPKLKFSEDEIAQGDAMLAKIGLVKGEYVAFHARDSKYGDKHHPEIIKRRQSKRLIMSVKMTEEHPFQKHRNVDFSVYYQAINFLKTRGLKAVRLGADAEGSYACDNLVDYASVREEMENPDLCDLYLMAHCKLYVGQATGISHLSCIWNVPAIAVNWFPYHPQSKPTANFKACRVKRIKIHGHLLNEFQSRHVFELASWEEMYAASSEFETIGNTPEEILQTLQSVLDARIEARAS